MAILWQFSILQFPDKAFLSGVYLKRAVNTNKVYKGWWSNMQMVMSSYFKKPDAKEKISITLGAHSFDVETDKHGSFTHTYPGVLPLHNEVLVSDDEEELTYTQPYPSYFDLQNHKLGVISDIDETIIRSYTATWYRRIAVTLFKPLKKRKTIAFTEGFYKDLVDHKSTFFYVSKSESNLFPLLSGFIISNKLPVGPLFLTPYLRVFGLIGNKKPKNFKLDKCRFVLNESGTLPFILVGDDSQHDIDIYENIVASYGERIKGVFIRQTKLSSKAAVNLRLEKLRSKNLMVLYFASEQEYNSEILRKLNL